MHGLRLEQGGEGGVGGGFAQDPRTGLVCLFSWFGLVWSLGLVGFKLCTGLKSRFFSSIGLVWFGHWVWFGWFQTLGRTQEQVWFVLKEQAWFGHWVWSGRVSAFDRER